MDKIILPPSTIGIIGGGQLGRMMAISARQMGYKIAVLEPGKDSPLAQIADMEINAPYDDEAALKQLLEISDVVTYEFENIPAAQIEKLASFGNLPQGYRPLEITQNRSREKNAIQEAGFKTTGFRDVTSASDFEKAYEEIGAPCLLKTVSGGYDGKGQWFIKSDADLAEVRKAVASGEAFVLERFVNFQKEISVIVTRGVNGDVQAFPAIENIHENQILHVSIAPAKIDAELAEKAEKLAKSLIEKLDFVGTLAIEMFVTEEDIIINELAPRPHNSGHLTIDAFNVSQFEQHIRAICGLPLIKPELMTPATMVNLLGQHMDYTLSTWRAPEFAHGKLHLYGKEEMKRDRKVGHLNFMGADVKTLEELVAKFLKGFPE